MYMGPNAHTLPAMHERMNGESDQAMHHPLFHDTARPRLNKQRDDFHAARRRRARHATQAIHGRAPCHEAGVPASSGPDAGEPEAFVHGTFHTGRGICTMASQNAVSVGPHVGNRRLVTTSRAIRPKRIVMEHCLPHGY